MEIQTIYILYVKGKDNSQGIAQFWLVGEIQHTLLVIMDKNYWAIRILIATKTRDKLGIGLKTYDLLKSAWSLTSLNTEISMLIKKDFIDSIVRIISDNEYKTNVNSLLRNEIYS